MKHALLRAGGLTAMLIATRAAAQAPDPVGKWFSDRGIAIRKVFDGSKDEQNPASIFLVREPTGKDRTFASIDVAAKVREVEWNPGTSGSVLLYPVVDYHRSTNASTPVDKAGGTARLEVRPVGLSVPRPPDASGPAPTLVGTYWSVAPTFILDAKLSRDWTSQNNEQRYSIQVFPTGLRKGLPGSSIRGPKGTFFRYYPYVGLERYRFGTSGTDMTLTAGLARLWLEAWPVPTPTAQFLQMTFDLTGRRRIGNEARLPSQLSDVALGATVYLDGRGGDNSHVGIGVEYANGRDVTAQFARRERATIGLKVKF